MITVEATAATMPAVTAVIVLVIKSTPFYFVMTALVVIKAMSLNTFGAIDNAPLIFICSKEKITYGSDKTVHLKKMKKN